MDIDLGVLRGIEDAVDAIARLDELVTSATPGLAAVLMLRTAQTIVAANDRPFGNDSHLPQAGGDAEFAALLGWWYAPASRAYVTCDPVLNGTAVALHSAAEMVRDGRALTLGLLDDALRATDAALGSLPFAFDGVLRASESGGWPSLMRCAALSSNDCGLERGIPASIARAVAPVADGPFADVYLAPSCTDTMAASLHALAENARNVRRRVLAYRERTVAAREQCAEFGRGGPSARAVVDLIARSPALTIGGAASTQGLTAPSAGAAVDRLVAAGLLREITGRGRDRVFVYTPAMALIG